MILIEFYDKNMNKLSPSLELQKIKRRECKSISKRRLFEFEHYYFSQLETTGS